MVLGKKVAIIYWEWGRNSAPKDEQKRPWKQTRKKNIQFTEAFLSTGLQFRVRNENLNFFISQSKHMLWVLKRTISMRRFFWASKTYVKTDW